jgi:hypothetical protein
MQPYEVICAPYVAYLAPTGTAFPSLTTDPSVTTPWTTLGISGALSQTDTGVTVTNSQTISTFVPGGSTAIRKAWRTAEELMVALEIADMTTATYALIMNDATINTVAPTTSVPGDTHIEMKRGVQVAAFALLVRGISPYQEAYSAQYEIPACYDAGNPAPHFSKQGPATLTVEFHAYELTYGTLGTWRAQTAPHS